MASGDGGGDSVTADDNDAIDVHIADIRCEGSLLKPPKRYHLVISLTSSPPSIFVGPKKTKTSVMKCTVNGLLWQSPLQNPSFTLSGINPKALLTVSLMRQHRMLPNEAVGEFQFVIAHDMGTISQALLSKNGATLANCTITVSISQTQTMIRSRATQQTAVAMGARILESAPAEAGPKLEVVHRRSAWEILLDRLERIDGVMSALDDMAKIHLWAQLAWGLVSVAYRVVIAQKDRDSAIENLAGAMLESCDFVEDAKSLSERSTRHREIMQKIFQQLIECAYFIRDYTKDRSFGLRIAKYVVSDVDTRIEQFKNNLAALSDSLRTHSVIQSHVSVCRMSEVVNTIKDAVDASFAFNLLRDLQYTADAQPELEAGCLPGTRVEVINAIVRWATGADEPPLPLRAATSVDHSSETTSLASLRSDDSSRVLWICGMAGTGKSSIWRSVAARLAEMDRLGARYAFSASRAATNPSNLFSTIARQLADKDRLRKERLVDIIKDDTVLRETKNCTKQFMSFVVGPSTDLPSIGETFILIDAFDESAGPRDPARAEALAMLTTEAHRLPPGLRVIITSRPEPDVQDALRQSPPGVHVLQTHDIPSELTSRDIEVYVKHEMRDILGLDVGENDEKLSALITRAGESFQWASTACKYVKERQAGEDPTPRLDRMLSTGADLGALYRTVLEEHFGSDPQALGRLRLVLGRIMVTQEPLSFKSFVSLVHTPLSRTEYQLQREVLQHLGALLSGTNSDISPLSPLHPSFRDFVCSDHSVPYMIDSGICHAQLALGCLAVMKAELRFDISRFPSSSLRNRDVTDLQRRIQQYISPALSYGCKFWAYHASRTAAWPPELIREIAEFFNVRFLWWLEVMSLTETSAHNTLAVLSDLMTLEHLPADVVSLFRDARRFVLYFAIPIAQSLPHIYLSALTFAPKSPSIVEKHTPLYPKRASLHQGQLEQWSNLIHVLETHSPVKSISCSPDGTRIAAGIDDSSFQLWSARTGTMITAPMTESTSQTRCIAFSPNGLQLVLGTTLHTIHLCDGVTGKSIGNPWLGHTGSVNSIAWSPDGTKVVSGSVDQTLALWDAHTGLRVRQFTRHTGLVESVAFSPDGKEIISGSRDATVQLWEVSTGRSTGLPWYDKRPYRGSVSSVSYSPDGSRIAIGSNSYPGPINLCDARTKERIGEGLAGHTKGVLSVAFSSCGTRAVSGAADNSLSLWDVVIGTRIGPPFIGHTSWVTSVAFLPGSTQVVSGSLDRSIRLWDISAHSLKPLLDDQALNPPLAAFSPNGMYFVWSRNNSLRLCRAKTGKSVGTSWIACNWRYYITCVEFSPDSLQVVSGSTEGTICLWSVNTGECVGGPWPCAVSPVFSAAFSLNGERVETMSIQGEFCSLSATDGTNVHEVQLGPMSNSPWRFRASVSHNGTRATRTTVDGSLLLWDLGSGSLVSGPWAGHTKDATAVTFSLDGTQIVSASEDRTLRLWDVESGKCIGEPFAAQEDIGQIRSVAFSPDGKMIAVGSSNRSIYLWDVKHQQCVGEPLGGHLSSVTSVVFSPDGTSLMSCSNDGTVRLWDLRLCTGSSPLEGKIFRQDAAHCSTHAQAGDIPEIIAPASQYPLALFPKRIFSINRDGWIVGAKGQIVVWVPAAHRLGLYLPHSRSVGTSHVTELNFGEYVGGEDWAQCYKSPRA